MEGATSIEKALDVLFYLHGAGEPCGVTAIGRGLGLPKSSAHRLLSSLGRRGLVEQDDRGRYRPGIALVALGLGVLDREPVVAAARPVLESEAERIGETCFLVAARAGRLVVLEKVEGRGFLRASPQVGSSVPVHATAAGKLYAAFAPDEVAGEPNPTAFTAATPRTEQQIADAAASARALGWAMNRDEWIEGLTVLAAPVFGGARLAAVIAVACPSARVEELGLDSLAAGVVDAGRRISERLSGTERRT